MPVESEQAQKPLYLTPGESLGVLSRILFISNDLILAIPLLQLASEL